jgi:predicted site-specific integrase-resolvase
VVTAATTSGNSSPNDCAPKTALRTLAYARVSSHDQKEDLERQKQVLELYCSVGSSRT